MRAKHLVAAITAALISAPVAAQTVKAGITAWQKADYGGAVAIWRPLAERGDPDAEFNLGQAYRLGRGVPLDLSAAKSWFEKAADSGHLDAETTLGLLLFQNGDHASGLKWLRRAAEQGEPRALLVYGTALYNGDGVTQDRELGYAYVSRAADEGLAPAKETLAQLDSLMPEAERRKALILARAKPPTPAGPVRQTVTLKETAKARSHAPSKVAPATPAPTRIAQATTTPARTTQGRNSPRNSVARTAAKTAVATAGAAPAVTSRAAHGAWRIQLGAFAQRASAETLYRRLSGKSALSGRSAFYVAAGPVTRLQVGPFESRAAAGEACSSLHIACFTVPAK